ncbi:alpha/beta fold hydrolase [Ekhidna sp.]|jgi:alpha-beta hydrolase superfamily lysophospholipase|uniref:alpha/beta hydrolase n=1 Tax=Ekhidna sp. TaxID=2608089 RepID=UPI0032EF3D8E
MKTLFTLIYLFIILSATGQQFTEKEVEMDKLKGTLSIPESKTNIAILLIAGSGPTDRNGNNALGFTNNSLKMAAHELSKTGYAVLRTDKRGIAASKEAVEYPTNLRFEHFVEDAKSWLNFLNQEGYKKLIIAGHSQGSLVGMMAAQDNENVVGFISLAGLAEDAGEAIVRQLGAQSPVLAEDARVNMDSMKAGYTVKKFNPYLISLFGPAIQPFLKSYISYSPAEEIKKLDIPVLIINGTTDIQIEVSQADSLKKAYPKADLLIIEGMNHVLKDAPADPAANMATYNNPELPLSDDLITDMITFIKKL